MVKGKDNFRETDPNKALAVLCTAAFLVPFMGSSLNLALPEIARDFSIRAVTLTWLSTAYIISTAIFQIPASRIADIVGRKRIFELGVVIFSVCTFMCGFAPSEVWLIALRSLSGAGSAMMFGTNLAIISSLFPPDRRGKALGINSAVVYAAAAAGPFLGGMLTHYLGWHSIFFVSAGIGIVVFVMSRTFLHGEQRVARGEHFDVLGSVLYGIGLAGLIYGFSSLPKTVGIVSLAVGAAGFVAFALYELRHKFPVFNLRLFSGNKVFTLSSLAALINYAATSGIGFMLSLYLQYIRGLDASHAGFILISQAIVQSSFSLVAGSLSHRFEPYKMATAGMVIIVVGIVCLTTLGYQTPYWVIIGILMMLGMGFGIFSSPNTNVIMGSVDKANYSAASATTGTVRLTGQAVSMGIASLSISLHVGNQQIVPELYPQFMSSVRGTFVIFAVLCAVGIWAASVRNRRHEDDKKQSAIIGKKS